MITCGQAGDMAQAHAEGRQADLPRGDCPECEDCEHWRVAVLTGVRVVISPIQPLLATIHAELRPIEQASKDLAVTWAEPGGT